MITTRTATAGLIIPPRSMTQMFFSALNGVFSLISENARIRFIDTLEKGIIQEGVLSQATAGPIMMLSLFNDLQNPLFKKTKFDPNIFLDGLSKWIFLLFEHAAWISTPHFFFNSPCA